MAEQVILVDQEDNEIGIGEKLETHRQAKLHRAFSIFIFNSRKEMMLQLRAKNKYHGGGLWTNTCCGHPRPGETVEKAAKRRLKEEMGFECELTKMFDYIYKVSLDKSMNEHEFLHVFRGVYDGVPMLNPDEADDWKWMSVSDVKADIRKNPHNYTPWFKLSMERIM
ncbi:MAG: isopentenyl-diphosphate Delta-isomerase [Candidatus Woesearchaeota archaeon]